MGLTCGPGVKRILTSNSLPASRVVGLSVSMKHSRGRQTSVHPVHPSASTSEIQNDAPASVVSNFSPVISLHVYHISDLGLRIESGVSWIKTNNGYNSHHFCSRKDKDSRRQINTLYMIYI